MSVAVDIPRKRIHIKGDLLTAFYWLVREFMPMYNMYLDRPFWMTKNSKGEVILEELNGWTLTHEH